MLYFILPDLLQAIWQALKLGRRFLKELQFYFRAGQAQEKTIRILSGQTFRERKEHEQHILGQRSPEEVRDLMYKRAFALELTIDNLVRMC